MGTYKKIPAKYKVNSKGIKLFEPKSDERVRKDKITGLWMKHRKRTYLYWYKFIQICLQKKLPIEKNKYRGWDIDTILDTKFDVWFESHKKDLFQTKEQGQEPKVKYPKSTKVKIDSIRFSYLVCCMNENLSFWKHGKLKQYKGKSKWIRIAYEIIKYDLSNRYPTNSNMFYPLDSDSKPVHPDDLLKEKVKTKKEDAFDKVVLKKIDSVTNTRNVRDKITERISKHKSRYQKIIENVQKGNFP